MEQVVKVYDTSMNLKAILENAFNVSYEQRFNELHTAKFSMPGSDLKNDECQTFRYVEIFDNGNSVDLFRIMPDNLNKNANGLIKDYECEHVITTLTNDILFKYHQTVNLSPEDTINYILTAQKTVNWQLGTCDFTATFSYKWENESLYNALFSIPKVYGEEYQWTWDTSTTPWTLNLIRPSTTVSAYVRYRKNLVGIQKYTDPRKIKTRFYPLGYGEGVNQLTIESVNSGVAYIDADTIGTYGIIEAAFVDTKEENAATLKARAEATLKEMSVPRITYSIDAADISSITRDSADKFILGSCANVRDEETGINVSGRVMYVSKPDITGSPGSIQIEISNKSLDITDLYSSFESRLIAGETYSQGAVNIDSNDYQDNCDSTHPATVKFYLPSETVRVNKCLLSFESSAFRAYETGAASGGGSTSGAGGGTTVTSASGGGSTQTSSLQSYHTHDIDTSTNVGGNTGEAEGHTHTYTYQYQYITEGGGGHSHTVDIPNHTHNVTISDHTHTTPNHTHEISYGIYEYSASATAVTVTVDGHTVTAITTLTITDFDIIPYLNVDGDGKIARGAWHTVSVTPNNLSRITASVVKQVFVQSRGGGDY